MVVALLVWLSLVSAPVWLAALGGIVLGSGVFGALALAVQIREVQSGVQLVSRRVARWIGYKA